MCPEMCVCLQRFTANALSTTMFYALCCPGEDNYVYVSVQYMCVFVRVHSPTIKPFKLAWTMSGAAKPR